MSVERRCGAWGCPGPESPLRCKECGGCCNWPRTPHLSLEEANAIEQVGARFEADGCGTECEHWEVVGQVQRSFVCDGRIIAVKPLGPSPQGRYEFEVQPCGALHYIYELKGAGHQSGSGGCRQFAMLGRVVQGVLL